MLKLLRRNWNIYLMEAWALGMFMISAGLFVILIEHPDLPVRQVITTPLLRRMLVGLAMGITAVLLINSKWGKRSGAHMNPAVTTTFLLLNRIRLADAMWYIVFQFVGGFLGVLVLKWGLFRFISDPSVNYVVTMPGPDGIAIALIMEFLLSFIIIITVLLSSNSTKMAPFTGYLVGFLLFLFIAFEAPFSGMSINPARTIASSIAANEWNGWWIYFISPMSGMLSGGYLYRTWYRGQHQGSCTTMNMHLSGYLHGCATYEVLGPKRLLDIKNNDVHNE